jgi:hypothetical protein
MDPRPQPEQLPNSYMATNYSNSVRIKERSNWTESKSKSGIGCHAVIFPLALVIR